MCGWSTGKVMICSPSCNSRSAYYDVLPLLFHPFLLGARTEICRNIILNQLNVRKSAFLDHAFQVVVLAIDCPQPLDYRQLDLTSQAHIWPYTRREFHGQVKVWVLVIIEFDRHDEFAGNRSLEGLPLQPELDMFRIDEK